MFYISYHTTVSWTLPCTTKYMEILDKNLLTKPWLPSWKFVIITVLIGVNIIFIRIIGVLVYQNQSLKEEKKLCVRTTEPPAVYQNQSLESEIMELKKQLCVSVTKPPPGCTLCPNNWQLYGDNCYYSDVTKRSWILSQDHCEMMGAHLLVIEDREQEGFILSMLTQQAEVMFWIGLYHEGDGWRWVNGRHYNTSLFQLKVNSGNCALPLAKISSTSPTPSASSRTHDPGLNKMSNEDLCSTAENFQQRYKKENVNRSTQLNGLAMLNINCESWIFYLYCCICRKKLVQQF
ncbi:C-type lectin domain family 7 member A-like [Mixophyes fleayi]|uniref:C-type lectin domain family 7 member A-like n=1 Tax=Mixophyes fleayi TaxID=3061075 RepID=UPI003F4E2119